MEITFKQVRTFRRISQVFVLFLFILIPILNLNGINIIRGNFYASNFFGIPLMDPFVGLQTILGVGGNQWGYISFFDAVSLNIWIGMLLPLILAFFMGPMFCSWFCPYGFFSELVWKYLGGKKKWLTRRQNDKPRKLYFIKFFIFIVSCVLVVVLKEGPIGNALSMPGWYAKIWQDLFLYEKLLYIPLAFFLIMLVLEFVFKKRFWCLYLCPQSVMLAIVARISPYRLHIKFQDANCTCAPLDRACLQNCSLQLNSRKLVGSERMQCTNCFECAMHCARGCKTPHDKGIKPTFTYK